MRWFSASSLRARMLLIVLEFLLVLVLIWRPGGVIGGQEIRLPRFKGKGKDKGAEAETLAA